MGQRYELSEEERTVIEEAAGSRWYREQPVPQHLSDQLEHDLLGFTFVPRRQRQMLEAVYGPGVDALAALQADWEAALASGALYLFRDDLVSFALHVAKVNGTALTASIRPSTHPGSKPWYLAYVPDVAKIQLARGALDAAGASASAVGAGAPVGPLGAGGGAPAAARSAAPDVSAAGPDGVPAPGWGAAPDGPAASDGPAAPATLPGGLGSAASNGPTVPAVASDEPARAVAPAPAGSVAVLPPLLEGAMLDLAATRDYVEHPVEPNLLDGLADGAAFSSLTVVNTGLCARIVEATGGAVADAAACRRLLDRDWAFALAHDAVRLYEDADGSGQKVFFPISVLRADGETPMEVGFWRNRNHRPGQAGSKPWFAFFLNDFVKRQPAVRSLFRWAYLGPLEEFLAELAAKALPEPWDFSEDGPVEAAAGAQRAAALGGGGAPGAPGVGNGPEGPDDGGEPAVPGYGILRNYLFYTFHRLRQQKPCGVLENEREGIAAFNTGLVDETYEPIYAVFSANEHEDAQPWRFQAFCRAGSSANGGWGARLSQAFPELPPRARYVERTEDLLFDTARELDINYDHILLENIDRLPLEFLREEFPRSARDMLAELEAAHAASGGEAEERFAALRARIQTEPKIYRRLKNRLEDAVELARKRVEWNFRTAVPSYYPALDSMSLLLPLDLTDDGRADVALVVELAGSGRYLARTILTMRMAYLDARLVCRPESDWLAPPR